MSIEKHLKKYYKDPSKEEVLELILDSVSFSELKSEEKKLLEEFTNAQLFSMNFCGLKSLNYLPEFAQLEAVCSINIDGS